MTAEVAAFCPFPTCSLLPLPDPAMIIIPPAINRIKRTIPAKATALERIIETKLPTPPPGFPNGEWNTEPMFI